jgi:hypothetical protein
MVLPGSGRTLEQFQLDDMACRGWATEQTESGKGAAGGSGLSAQGRYDIAYMQCMFAKAIVSRSGGAHRHLRRRPGLRPLSRTP